MCCTQQFSHVQLCNPTDCSPPGSSVHGILQARILEWVAIPFSRGSSWPRGWTKVSHTAGRFFTIWTTSKVNPKGNQSWIFTGRTDAKAEAPGLWPPDVKSWLIGKDPDAGKDWRQEEKGTTEMVGWHQLDGHEFEQALGVGDGQRSLACCSPCGCKELDTTEQLNWTLHVTNCSYFRSNIVLVMISCCLTGPKTTLPRVFFLNEQLKNCAVLHLSSSVLNFRWGGSHLWSC